MIGIPVFSPQRLICSESAIRRGAKGEYLKLNCCKRMFVFSAHHHWVDLFFFLSWTGMDVRGTNMQSISPSACVTVNCLGSRRCTVRVCDPDPPRENHAQQQQQKKPLADLWASALLRLVCYSRDGILPLYLLHFNQCFLRAKRCVGAAEFKQGMFELHFKKRREKPTTYKILDGEWFNCHVIVLTVRISTL